MTFTHRDRKVLAIKNLKKNPIVVDDMVLRKGETAVLKKESELIIGGEPIIVSNYEFINQQSAKENYYADLKDEQTATPGFNLKECLLGFYKYKKVIEQRKEQ